MEVKAMNLQNSIRDISTAQMSKLFALLFYHTIHNDVFVV
jgi:hypothetical protein